MRILIGELKQEQKFNNRFQACKAQVMIMQILSKHQIKYKKGTHNACVPQTPQDFQHFLKFCSTYSEHHSPPSNTWRHGDVKGDLPGYVTGHH